MGIVSADIVTIGEFLQNKNLHIPHFQRPYKWTLRNVIQLIDDIERFKGETPYRIGTIVIYRDNGKENIVDGQQRTVTFLLMVRCIMLSKFDQLSNEGLKKLLQNIKETSFAPKFKHEQSQKNIQDNYREIDRRIASLDEGFIQFFLNKCEVTRFIIDDISEAFQFFDSQNSRGKDLEPHDLLKAFHLRELNSGDEVLSETEVARLVDTWEEMDTSQLSHLFANFLYRVRGWSKGNSSRYFTKEDTHLFKGINLSTIDNYPYTNIYRMVHDHLKESDSAGDTLSFPFQLDQIIINGKHFFEMITYYKSIYDNIENNIASLTNNAQKIMDTLNNYKGKNRTGDKYVRMLFNCALLYYVDKFGQREISKAIERIFIWAYVIRLTYQNLQLASVDNYVIHTFNIFKKIKESVYKEDITTLELPLIQDDYESDKTRAIKELFIEMKYYANKR